MGAKTQQGGKTAAVSKVASAREADIAESFRRARGALGEVARDVKQLRGRAGIARQEDQTAALDHSRPMRADPDDAGLLSAAQTSLLIDRYELAMAASYHRRGMNDPAVFELFVRKLPPTRDWLLAAGLGPALTMVREMRFGDEELAYLETLGFEHGVPRVPGRLPLLRRRGGDPRGHVVFAGEPLVRVTAPRIEGQLLETLLLNQLNFQTAVATKAARIVLAIGAGLPDPDGRLIDFSPRRDHGVDAAMKAARSAAIAGAGGTSNVAAAMRYGLRAVGTMAHSYVMSFEHEQEAFRAFMEDVPGNAVMLVDTYDTLEGVRRAIAAARESGVALAGVRIDSGDLLSTLARGARAARRGGNHRGGDRRQRRPR